MDNLKLASGDNNTATLINMSTDEEKIKRDNDLIPHSINEFDTPEREEVEKGGEDQIRLKQSSICDEMTSDMVDEHETKLKERVAQCKSIIASLKLELQEEKSKLQKEAQAAQHFSDKHVPTTTILTQPEMDSINFLNDLSQTTKLLSTSLDSDLNCDENLMEYEKQLQRYQNTLNMAQNEKKNAIRKQMLAKAYKLKLLEVENQCNIELLRIKQSLQCLEPLQMIVEKWKDTNEDLSYDVTNFELIPRFPELYANSGSDINFFNDMSNYKQSPSKDNINSTSTTFN